MSPRPAKTPAPLPPEAPSPWMPDLKWHLKVLSGIYVFLFIVYVGVNAILSRLPAPYGLRDIPREVTPWLKK